MSVPAEFDRLHVVLVATRNPLNIGAAARAMSNFGFTQLRVVRPFDVAFREARSAVGASDVLVHATEYGSVSEAVADCTLVVGTTAVGHREPQHDVRRLEAGGPILRSHLREGRVALLFGSEKVGLSNEDLSHCHWLLRIPTREEHASMNLGQAVAVCLYEVLRAPEVSEQVITPKAASAASLELITRMLLDGLRLSGYVNPNGGEAAEQKTRRMVHRLSLTQSDAAVLLGMLRQILWKLGQDS